MKLILGSASKAVSHLAARLNFSANATAAAADTHAGESLPEWDLTDLYASVDDPKITADLERVGALAADMKSKFKDQLSDIARDSGQLLNLIEQYEQISDTMGRLGSFAGLRYAADQSDPDRAKFYGDINDKLLAISTDLIFLELELNTIDDAIIDKALTDPKLARYAPWFRDLRRERPYQLKEEIERLFTEKAATSGSWSRLFNETMTGLRFSVDGVDEPMTLEPTLNLMSDTDEAKRKAGSDALAKVFKDNVRLFSLITNTL
ncbi:MAG: oligoendopeptidase F, partial [Pseudomonadota bacterium]